MIETPPSSALARDLPFLADLGFVLVDGERPDHDPGPRLLVALRDSPTFAHFDPEWILVWATNGGRGNRTRMDREHVPAAGTFAWGTIRVYDRLDLFNSFVTFGGAFEAGRVAEDLIVIRFASPAPILRWSGHSQPLDRLAPDVESFFARLMIPIDFSPGAEAMVNATSPLGLYAAMVNDFATRVDAMKDDAWGRADPEADQWAIAERTRLRSDAEAAWAEGGNLLERVGIRRAR